MFYHMTCGVKGESGTYESCTVVLMGDLEGGFTRGLPVSPK